MLQVQYDEHMIWDFTHLLACVFLMLVFFSIRASLYLCILYFRYWDLFRKWWMSDISTLKTFHFHMALEHTYTQHTGTCAHACLTPNMTISTKEKTAWNFIEKNYRDWTSYTQCWQKRIFWKPAVCNCLPLYIYSRICSVTDSTWLSLSLIHVVQYFNEVLIICKLSSHSLNTLSLLKPCTGFKLPCLSSDLISRSWT